MASWEHDALDLVYVPSTELPLGDFGMVGWLIGRCMSAIKIIVYETVLGDGY